MFEIHSYFIGILAFLFCFTPFYLIFRDQGAFVVCIIFLFTTILYGLILSKFSLFSGIWLLPFYGTLLIFGIYKEFKRKTKKQSSIDKKTWIVLGLFSLFLLFLNSLLDFPFAFDRGIHFSRALYLLGHESMSRYYPGTDYFEFYFQGPHIILGTLLSVGLSLYAGVFADLMQPLNLEFLLYSFNAYWTLLTLLILWTLVENFSKKEFQSFLGPILLSIPFIIIAFSFAGSIGVTLTVFLFPSILLLFYKIVYEPYKYHYSILCILTVLALFTHPTFISLVAISYGFFFFFLLFRKDILPPYKKEVLFKLILTGSTSLFIALGLYILLYPEFLIGFYDELIRKSSADMIQFIAHLKHYVPPKEISYFMENFNLLLTHPLWILLTALGCIFVIYTLLYQSKNPKTSWFVGGTIAFLILVTFKIVPPLKSFEYTFLLILLGLYLLKSLLIRNQSLRFFLIIIAFLIGLPKAIEYSQSKNYIKKEDYLHMQSMAKYINTQEVGKNTLIMGIGPLSYTLNSLTKNGKVYFGEYKYPDLPQYNELSFFFEGDENEQKDVIKKTYNIGYIVLPNKTYTNIFSKYPESYYKSVTKGNFSLLETLYETPGNK